MSSGEFALLQQEVAYLREDVAEIKSVITWVGRIVLSAVIVAVLALVVGGERVDALLSSAPLETASLDPAPAHTPVSSLETRVLGDPGPCTG